MSVLSQELRAQLVGVEPSICGKVRYFPCAVVLKSGRKLDRVFFVERNAFLAVWGVSPEIDRTKRSIDSKDVATLMESSYRLPATFAAQIYAAGESGMGYSVFTVRFSDGSTQAYLTGNAVDFVDYPPDKGPTDVVSLTPHAGRDANPQPGPKYVWCLFDEPDGAGGKDAGGELDPYRDLGWPRILKHYARRLWKYASGLRSGTTQH